MSKLSKTAILAIGLGLLALVWIFLMVAYTIVRELSWMCWGSIACTVICVIICELYLLLGKTDVGQQAEEQGAMGSIITICYFFITLVLNTIFVLLSFTGLNWLLFALNFVVAVCYFILILWVEKHTERMSHQLSRSEQKLSHPREISRKLGELLAIVEDQQTRDRLLKLKEAVDYGSNISTNATLDAELRMEIALDELAQLSIARADSHILSSKVEAAEAIWKQRSSIASTVR